MSILGVPPLIKEEEKEKKEPKYIVLEEKETGRRFSYPAGKYALEKGLAEFREREALKPPTLGRLEKISTGELPKIPEKDTLFKKVARFVLPKSLELRLDLRKPTKAEEIRQWGRDVEEYYGRGEDIVGGIRTFGEGLTKLPKATAVAILQASQGIEGPDVLDPDWADRYVEDATKDLNKFVQETQEKYKDKTLVSGLPLKITDLAEFPQNLAFSLTSMGAGLGVGVSIGWIPLPGARVAAWTLGTAASGAVAYNMTTYQIMQTYLESKNEESIKEKGRQMTHEEQESHRTIFAAKAMEYGLWEAIPEAISNLAFVKILTTPLLKMGIGKTTTGKILTKITGLYGEELLTETITQKGQSDIEIEAGLRERRISWTEAFKEIAPQTFLLTTVMAGSGSAIIQTQKGIDKITNSLKNEIGTAHLLFDQLKIHIEEAVTEIRERPEAGFIRLPGEEPIAKFEEGETIKVAVEKIDIKELQKLPGGGMRDVYKIDNTKVIKIAKNPLGLEQNDLAGEILLGKWLPKVFETGKDYIVVENVPRNDKVTREFLKPLQRFSNIDWENKDNELIKVMEEMGLEDFFNYDLLFNDFKAYRNWGMRGNQSVLIDEGAIAKAIHFGAEPNPESVTDWREILTQRKATKAIKPEVKPEIPKEIVWSKDMDVWYPNEKADVAIHILGPEVTANEKYIVRFVDEKTQKTISDSASTMAEAKKIFTELKAEVLPVKPLPEVPKITPEEVKTKLEQAEGEIWQALSWSEAGERIMIEPDILSKETEYSFLAKPSSFPNWIPEHLREKSLLDKVSEHLIEGTAPSPAFKAQRELYDIVRERVVEKAGLTKEELELAPDVWKKAPEKVRKTVRQLEKMVRGLIREARVPGKVPTKAVVRKVTGQVKPGLTEFTRRMRDLIRGVREGRIATKQEIKATQTQLLDILDKSELSLNDKAKFRATIKNIQTQEQLQRALPEFQERIETLLEAEEVRSLKSQIRKVLEKTKIRKRAGRPIGKYTPAVQRVLDSSREAIKLNAVEAEEKIRENLDMYKEKSMPIEIAIQNRILDMNSQESKGLRELLNIIKEIEETGNMARALQDFNIQEDLDRKKKYLVDVVTDYKGVTEARQTTGITQKTFKERAIQNLKSLGQDFVLSWRGLMQVLDWHTHIDKKTLADRYSVLDQENKYKELQEGYVNDFNKMFADVYDIPTKTLKDQIALPIRVNRQILELKDEINLGTFTNTIGQKVEIKITRDEMVKRYMEFQDPTLIDSFREGNNYTEEIKDAIRAELTNQEKELANKQLELYKKQYDKINPIYKKMYGVDLPFNEFYSPIMREGYRLDIKEGFQTFLDEASLRKAVTSKSFITRIRNALPIAKQGSLEAMDRHITQTNYFVAWAEKVRELDNIFADPSVREVIREEFGNSLLRQVMKNIEDFGYNRRIRGQIHPAINWLRQKFTLGALMLKPALAGKQMVSTLAYLEKLSSVEFTVGVIDFWKNPVKNYRIMAKESTFIRTRGKQGEMERDIRAALRSDVYSRFSKLHNFWNMAMMNVRFGDKGAIITGSWAMRKARLAKGKDINKTIKEYEEFSAETQQSADISQLSAVQKGGSFSVLFTMFKSSQRQYLAKEVNAVKTLFQKGGTSPKNIKKVARILAIYHFLLPIFFQWVANFGGWDEEDRKEYIRAGILGSLNGWFIAGDIVDGIVRKALDLRVWPQEVPIVSIGDDLQQFIGKIDLNNISISDMKDALFELGDAGNALGIPVKYIINLYKGVIEILKGDIDEGIGLLLGWSEYVLKRAKKKKAPKGILGPPPPVVK